MQKRNAFSLLELSLIIITISTILMGYLMWTTVPSINDGVKYQATQQKIKVIHQAIENFIAINRRLPCPATMQQAEGSFTAGDTWYNYYSLTGKTNSFSNILYDDEPIYISSNFTVYCVNPIGVIPTRALGLPADYQNDGWGRRFKFYVDKNLCGTSGCAPFSYRGTINPSLTVVNTTIAGATLVNDAAYGIVSSGSNGLGAYLPSGLLSPASLNADEIQNTVNLALPYTPNLASKIVQKPMVAGTYDDIVDFRTRDQIENSAYRAASVSLITQADCAANSAAIASLDTATMTNLSINVTIARRCITSNAFGCSTSDNTGDEAVFGILWAVQDACYELYGAKNTLARSCTIPFNSYTTSNACCPTMFGFAQGRAVNCGGAKYYTDSNSCGLLNYAQGVDCWIGN